MVYEPAAVAREDLPESVQDEWRRRVRIGAGVYQALILCRRCLSPRYGAFSLIFWSHKVLRWLTPHLMILLLGVSCWLIGEWMWKSEGWVVNLAGVGVASVWLAGMVAHETSSRCRKLFGLAWYFCAMQAALFVGFLRFCRGNLSGSWARTERGG